MCWRSMRPITQFSQWQMLSVPSLTSLERSFSILCACLVYPSLECLDSSATGRQASHFSGDALKWLLRPKGKTPRYYFTTLHLHEHWAAGLGCNLSRHPVLPCTSQAQSQARTLSPNFTRDVTTSEERARKAEGYKARAHVAGGGRRRRRPSPAPAPR